ncbi:MAG: GNAT family N-acetyltransferase [Burkholderiales bacterium]
MAGAFLPPPAIAAGPVVLRHFTAHDAEAVRALADDWEVARTTAALPHPYLPGMAESWIAGHEAARRDRGEHSYAIVRADDGVLVGSFGLRPAANDNGHFGYWVGRPHWGHGYATAATRAAIALLFAPGGLDLVWAVHLAHNESSARVMDKCGLAVLRSEIHDHRGTPQPMLVRGVTRAQWEARPAP